MPSTPVRVGLVGYGSGGRIFHAPLNAAAPECVLAAVMTGSPERRAAVAADHPGTPVHGSLAELAAPGVEAVTISPPAATHTDLVREAIGLGLAVVCDKP